MTSSARNASGEGAVAPYAGRRIALATMHGKEKAVAPSMRDVLGAQVVVPPGLDTDVLGTFSGEVARQGTMGEVAVAKARMGMAASGLRIGLASEGSYGPHPQVPFVAAGMEILVLVDDERGLAVTESLIDDAPCFGHVIAGADEDLGAFLDRICFPRHALIVCPNEPAAKGPFVKGIRKPTDLHSAIRAAVAASIDGRALVQTDMRAHMNPTRSSTLERLAARLAARLNCTCPACGAPGFGIVDVESGLPCEWCEGPSVMLRYQVFGCARTDCDYQEKRPRPDGLTHADPGNCTVCNP
ncbi:MAG: hypothetical protein RIC38_15905 [Chromatocurvus sp.]